MLGLDQAQNLKKKYDENFTWADLDDIEEERNNLIAEYQKDTDIQNGDLEEGMINNTPLATRNSMRAMPKLSSDDRCKSPK